MLFIDDRLARGETIILDGATGTELERRGVPMNNHAWSAAALLTHIDIIRRVHEDYIRAGADIIIANTFSTSRHVLEGAGLGDKFEHLNAGAAKVAQEARENVADRPVLVAGAISTSTFFQTQPPAEVAKKNFEDQADVLAAAGVDLIVLEMMRDVAYTRIVIEAVERTGLPIWIGFSCDQHADGSLKLVYNDTETLADGVVGVADKTASLMMVMHTLTELIVPSLESIQENWSGPVGVYAHSGKFVMPNWQFNDIISPEAYAAEAQIWVEMGAQVIGGCCGIGPDHIRLLKERLPMHITRS